MHRAVLDVGRTGKVLQPIVYLVPVPGMNIEVLVLLVLVSCVRIELPFFILSEFEFSSWRELDNSA